MDADASASASSPPSAPSVSELSAEFAQQKRPKSPPLAFEKTPNDALAPLTAFHPTGSPSNIDDVANMGRLSPSRVRSEHDWQVVVDQQAAAIHLLHDAFAAERSAWSLERDRLYHRIASLEKLLKSGDGHSPAKSPSLSPLGHSSFTSPQSRSVTNRLPSIAEDESLPPPLSQRREAAPQSIEITTSNHDRTEPTVTFHEDTPAEIKVEEIPISPSNGRTLSPPPLINRMEAGHTPIRAPRPLTPPPQNSLSIDGIDDTPTRNNTHINAFLTRSNDEEDDKGLTGPLCMPELPTEPDAMNFTFEALSKRLEQLEKHPEQSKPMVFAEPSPGLASPASEADDRSAEEKPLAPVSTNMPESSASELSSNALSSAALSPLSKHTSRDQHNEEKVQAEFENGGIKLKKKASTNFGTPFGQLGGFGSARWQ